LRFKIKNQLEKGDYKRLVDFFKKNPTVSIELFSGVDLKFVSVSLVTVAVEGFGYKIDTEILFEQPMQYCARAGWKMKFI